MIVPRCLCFALPKCIPTAAEGHAFAAFKIRAERPYRTPKDRSKAPKGEATDLCLCCFAFIFRVFPAKIACQALKPPNPITHNNIQLAYQLCRNRYHLYRDEKRKKPRSGNPLAKLLIAEFLHATPFF
jgi:hypothetical protein